MLYWFSALVFLFLCGTFMKVTLSTRISVSDFYGLLLIRIMKQDRTHHSYTHSHIHINCARLCCVFALSNELTKLIFVSSFCKSIKALLIHVRDGLVQSEISTPRKVNDQSVYTKEIFSGNRSSVLTSTLNRHTQIIIIQLYVTMRQKLADETATDSRTKLSCR